METLTYLAGLALAHPLGAIALLPFVLVAMLVGANLFVTLYFMAFAHPSTKDFALALLGAMLGTLRRSLPTALVITWGFFAGLWLIFQLNLLLK